MDSGQLAALQEEIEAISTGEGVRRFRKAYERAIETDPSRAAGYRTLLAKGLNPLIQEIDTWMASFDGKAGRRHVAYHFVTALGSETVAYLTLRHFLNGVAHGAPVTATAFNIATAVVDEVFLKRFQADAPAHYRRAIYALSNSKHEGHRRDGMKRQGRKAQEAGLLNRDDLDSLPRTSKVALGTALLDRAITSTGLCTLELTRKEPQRRRSRTGGMEYTLQPTAEMLSWLEQRLEALEELRPVWLPMVVPPLPWKKGGVRGGYRYGLKGRVPLVRGADREQVKALREADMPEVYEAMNRIQETPWTVNRRVLEVMDAVRKLGRPIAGIHPTEPQAPVVRPDTLDNEADPEFPAALEKYKAERTLWEREERDRRREVRNLDQMFLAIDSIGDAPRIYFPVTLDFRGRVYPIPNYLHFQGDDRQRGLLMFADGKPCGEAGRTWMALHLASCLDKCPMTGVKVSTFTLRDRLTLIEGLHLRILRTVREPLADLWWAGADKPWQFLAACFEWEQLHYHHDTAGDWSYCSGLPVAMDGTCNGLQHFAALLQDEGLAKAVNVSPSDVPQDIYSDIAADVQTAIEQDIANQDGTFAHGKKSYPVAALALSWLESGLLGRKMAKRPTMTFGYGSEAFGFAKQTLEYSRALDTYDGDRRLRDRTLQAFTRTPTDADPLKNTLSVASHYLADVLWDALIVRVSRASACMSWLKSNARAIAAGGKPVTWTVPVTGFPVRQPYWERKKVRIVTQLQGEMRYLVAWDRTALLSKHEQVNGISPNMIHSFDAAVLMLTVCNAGKRGLSHFSMVHDSYATVPADCDDLAEALRETFATFYTGGSVLSNMQEQLKAQVEDESRRDAMLPPPALGSLDCSGVLRSHYFFL
jgi:DNA-directed RNA polymerase